MFPLKENSNFKSMIDQGKKFRVHDRMMKIRFAAGIGGQQLRDRVINSFIDRYGETKYFEEWLAITEENNSLQNPGAFFRQMVSTGAVPNESLNQRSGYRESNSGYNN